MHAASAMWSMYTCGLPRRSAAEPRAWRASRPALGQIQSQQSSLHAKLRVNELNRLRCTLADPCATYQDRASARRWNFKMPRPRHVVRVESIANLAAQERLVCTCTWRRRGRCRTEFTAPPQCPSCTWGVRCAKRCTQLTRNRDHFEGQYFPS